MIYRCKKVTDKSLIGLGSTMNMLPGTLRSLSLLFAKYFSSENIPYFIIV